MNIEVSELYPMTGERKPLAGLYLEHDVYSLGRQGKPVVYANFVSSLDGRISLTQGKTRTAYLPNALTSDSDFRLFLELHAQADCLITHGGYLRALHENRLGNILQTGIHENSADLAIWRADRGMKPQPDIVVASASLDFPIPESLAEHGQRLIIATGKNADRSRVKHLQECGYTLITAGGERMVEGRFLVQQLSEMGYRSLYLIAGPHMLETMLRDKLLDRLYLTQIHALLGGSEFHTLIPNSELGSCGHLTLRSLYCDNSEPNSTGQWFACFDCAAEN